MLLDTLKNDALAARKARDAVRSALLTTLVAEAAKVGKDNGNRASTEAEVVAVVKKFIKNTEETLRVLEGNPAETPGEKLEGKPAEAQARSELEILMAYLPRQASEEDVRAKVAELVGGLSDRSPKQMGVVMAGLNAAFEGNFDKAVASKIVKTALAE